MSLCLSSASRITFSGSTLTYTPTHLFWTIPNTTLDKKYPATHLALPTSHCNIYEPPCIGNSLLGTALGGLFLFLRFNLRERKG